MRIQGIKGSIAWNAIKEASYPGINLEERNAVDIAKVIINKTNVNKIAASYPEVYENMLNLLNNNPDFKGCIEAVAIPKDIKVPEWITTFVDTDTILLDNISGFPFESLGIARMDRPKINYSNIVSL